MAKKPRGKNSNDVTGAAGAEDLIEKEEITIDNEEKKVDDTQETIVQDTAGIVVKEEEEKVP